MTGTSNPLPEVPIEKQPQSLLEAVTYFADPDRALAFVVTLRWPDGQPECPRCWSKGAGYLATRRIWKCRNPKCRKQFSAKVGTIFEDSPLGWDKWLPAIWLLANSKNSVSSHELGRALRVTQRTAWFMLHRIRHAMDSQTFQKLSGTVEADETAIGGAAKWMHQRRREQAISGRGSADKVIVHGVKERGGEIRAEVVPDTTAMRLQGNVRRWVRKGSAVYTDEAAAYQGLDRHGFAHKSVNHKVEYVVGDVSTNQVENFWSLLKRALKGTQTHVDPEHLHRYVTERTFAYNLRDRTDLGRMRAAVAGSAGRRLAWKVLTES